MNKTELAVRTAVYNVGEFFKGPKASYLSQGDYYQQQGGGFSSISGGKFRGALSKVPTLFQLSPEFVRDRARRCYFESPQARALVNRLADFVIGNGLSYQAAPVWEIIDGMGDPSDAAQKKRYKTKRDLDLRFAMWAGSHEPDACDEKTFYELQREEFINCLVDGETITVMRYSDDPNRMSPISLQFYMPEQLCNPKGYDPTAGVHISNGIETDEAGREIALWLKPPGNNSFQDTVTLSGGAYAGGNPQVGTAEPVRFPVRSASGRRFVIHHKMPGAVSMLAPYVHEFQKMDDARLAELEAMILNALFALWVEPGPDAKGTAIVDKLKQAGAKDQSSRPDNTSATLNQTFKGAMVAPSLKPGEKFNSFKTERPNLNVQEFNRNLYKGIASAEGVGVETAEMQYNSSYTAAVAAGKAFWVRVEIDRDETASQWLGLIHESWFVLEIAAGRIKTKGFGDSPLIRRAWLNAIWLGSSMPILDPFKEALAVEKRLTMGHTTGEREAMKYNNSDFNENVRQLDSEWEKLADARAPIAALELKGGQLALPLENDDEGSDTSDPKPVKGFVTRLA